MLGTDSGGQTAVMVAAGIGVVLLIVGLRLEPEVVQALANPTTPETPAPSREDEPQA